LKVLSVKETKEWRLTVRKESLRLAKSTNARRSRRQGRRGRGGTVRWYIKMKNNKKGYTY
jgi:hypothetical protein